MLIISPITNNTHPSAAFKVGQWNYTQIRTVYRVAQKSKPLSSIIIKSY